jgi:hypothetical protein
MSSPTQSQITLLTSHKGVDLHAATALLVMKDRLEGGRNLQGLFRCDMHTFWSGTGAPTMGRLLDSGRYFNPNKHHYGHFERQSGGSSWLDEDLAGQRLDPSWPGKTVATDLDPASFGEGGLYQRLLGGALPVGVSAVDVVSFGRGQGGPVLSGVVWRLWVTGNAEAPLELGRKLAVASHRKEGLLVNPHMEFWLAAVR